jgi:pyruvate kinase
MGLSIPQPPATDHFAELVANVESLRDEAARAADCADVQLREMAPGRLQSVENLHAYLALRAHDLEPLQDSLSRLGLASLDQAGPHVLATLDAILANLYLLDGSKISPAILPDPLSGFDAGLTLLRHNASHLLGPAAGLRRARIMVTLPAAAADDSQLLQILLSTGMDCARINCAYGDQSLWARMIARVRQAERDTGLACRIFMDLRGPKLRTGAMELEPAVLRIRPLRAANGNVLRPARIWLSADGGIPLAGELADARLALDPAWLQRAAPGDLVRLQDARGARRTWHIVARQGGGCWAEARKTSYLVNGTAFHLQRVKGQSLATTTLNSLPPCPSRVSLRSGDLLYLTCGDTPGKPSFRGLDGQLLQPGTIPLGVPEVFRDARAGEAVGFDDGRISGVIEQVDGDRLQVRIRHTRRPLEKLGGDKGVNLPETTLNLPALGKDDLHDLEFIAQQADIIGLSFTNGAADVRFLQQRLRELGRDDVGVILKLETRRGCANLPDILLEAMRLPSCGVMIARGDLAAECGFERLPELQEDILRLCAAAHMPVIWATGVLEGLARRGHPVRAEMTDAAAAQRAQCVMLGKGPYIGRALRTLDWILARTRQRECRRQSRPGALPRVGAG